MLIQSSSRNKSHFKNVNCAVSLAGAPEYELDPLSGGKPTANLHKARSLRFPDSRNPSIEFFQSNFRPNSQNPPSGIIQIVVHCHEFGTGFAMEETPLHWLLADLQERLGQ